MTDAFAALPLLDRRAALIGGAALMLPGTPACASAPRAQAAAITELRGLEKSANGRLGAYILDPACRNGFGWRENERFTQASSFKMSLAGMLLAGSDAGRIDLEEVLRWTAQDMLPVSPVTKDNLDTGLSVRRLAEATLVTSDNTAANVLLRRFGGPPALTAFWRSIGDATSRLDRYEPELNLTPPGTDLDTTTPAAMAATIAALVHGQALSAGSRDILRGWMADVKTGQDRIRASFPPTWVSGDKTGTGLNPKRQIYVDLAFGGPAGRTPLIVTAYFEPARPTESVNPDAIAVLAKVGRIAAASSSAS